MPDQAAIRETSAFTRAVTLLSSLDLYTRTVVLPIPNQGLEFDSDRRSLEGFPYHNSKAFENRSRATEEKAGSAPLESKRRVKRRSKTQAVSLEGWAPHALVGRLLSRSVPPSRDSGVKSANAWQASWDKRCVKAKP